MVGKNLQFMIVQFTTPQKLKGKFRKYDNKGDKDDKEPLKRKAKQPSVKELSVQLTK